MKTQWEIVEHNWSDTSIFNEYGMLVCTKDLNDVGCTEENQEELEIQTKKDFNLIVCANEMLDILKTVSNFMHRTSNEKDKLLLQEIDELINFVEKKTKTDDSKNNK